MNLDEFSTVVDDRRYIKPQVALDESNAFIENLRNTQGQRTAEIAQDTYNLGTAVPSNLGGLGGSGSYFTSRYQTPQTNEIVANLKATAQAQALNDAMNNALAQAKQRYNNAYKAAQKRSSSTGSTGPTNPTNPTNPTGSKLPITTNENNEKTTIPSGGSDTVSTLPKNATKGAYNVGSATVNGDTRIVTKEPNGLYHVQGLGSYRDGSSAWEQVKKKYNVRLNPYPGSSIWTIF